MLSTHFVHVVIVKGYVHLSSVYKTLQLTKEHLEVLLVDCKKAFDRVYSTFERNSSVHDFHETCYSVTFIVLVKSHQRGKQTRNHVCFHLWCELTLLLWWVSHRGVFRNRARGGQPLFFGQSSVVRGLFSDSVLYLM